MDFAQSARNSIPGRVSAINDTFQTPSKLGYGLSNTEST
ncbi:hypothetical protein NIES2104_11970 [Leptolyngbya sp. NIES-2104]|nr:hypothetical protein NIES2104_11970 [Leptolyngbya sp. NIES-2104]